MTHASGLQPIDDVVPALFGGAERDRRQRDELLSLAVDLAFETDAWGRLTFLAPADVLGWPAQSLIGKPAELLLAAPGSIAGFNPFRAATLVRGRRAWLNRAGGGHACLRFTCAPVTDAVGLPIGTRGVGTLEAAQDGGTPQTPAIDTLTGLPNRQAFLDELGRRMDRLDHDGVPSTLLCADLDCFRLLNVRRGPAFGDTVLARVAAMFTATLRPTDLVGRLDGDSFGLWLGGADHMTAAERAEALCLDVPALVNRLAEPDAPGGGVAAGPAISLSVGIAPHRLDGEETAAGLMRRALRALGSVKRGGGGHWRVAYPAVR